MATKQELKDQLEEALNRIKELEEGSQISMEIFPVDSAEKVGIIPMTYLTSTGSRYSFITGMVVGKDVGKIRGGAHDFYLVLMPKNVKTVMEVEEKESV